MKKLIISILGLMLPTIISSNNIGANESVIRSGEANVSEVNYFDDFKETTQDDIYYINALKSFDSSICSEFDLVSLDKDELIVNYDVVCNLNDGIITLEVYYDSIEESIVEDFNGIIMKNYNDQYDILFNIDEEHIYLSELLELEEYEQCSKLSTKLKKIWGNALHKSLNAYMLRMTVLEPCIKVLNYVGTGIAGILASASLNYIYGNNYKHNKSLTQPSGYVYGQSYYSNFKYGSTNLSNTGCEVVAGYNLAYAKGYDYSLADVTYLYEYLGIEIINAQGYFGANPYQISYFLKNVGIEYSRVLNYKTFNNYMEDNNDYYVILSQWNSEYATSGLHTFMVDKTCYGTSKKYIAYNFHNYYNYSDEYDDYSKLFESSEKNTFICAFIVEK